MAAPTVTVVGRLTADPELRFTPSGAAVANFTIASNDSYKDGSGEWVDKPAVFLRANIWRDAAENVAESLSKGDEVIAVGKLTQREFEDRDGNNRTVVELEVLSVGPSLRAATAKVNRAESKVGAGSGGSWRG